MYTLIDQGLGLCMRLNCSLWCSGQLETEIEENDVIVFISTLHGG